MRSSLLFLIAVISLAGGCASMIARSGTNLFEYTTREEMREEFGEPDASGHEDGRAYDEFYSHRKIADPMSAHGAGVLLVCTYGLSELITFPFELFDVGYTTVVGHDIRAHYDDNGLVTSRYIDGVELLKSPYALRPPRQPQTSPSVPSDSSTPDSDRSNAHSIEGGTSKAESTSPQG